MTLTLTLKVLMEQREELARQEAEAKALEQETGEAVKMVLVEPR